MNVNFIKLIQTVILAFLVNGCETSEQDLPNVVDKQSGKGSQSTGTDSKQPNTKQLNPDAANPKDQNASPKKDEGAASATPPTIKENINESSPKKLDPEIVKESLRAITKTRDQLQNALDIFKEIDKWNSIEWMYKNIGPFKQIDRNKEEKMKRAAENFINKHSGQTYYQVENMISSLTEMIDKGDSISTDNIKYFRTEYGHESELSVIATELSNNKTIYFNLVNAKLGTSAFDRDVVESLSQNTYKNLPLEVLIEFTGHLTKVSHDAIIFGGPKIHKKLSINTIKEKKYLDENGKEYTLKPKDIKNIFLLKLNYAFFSHYSEKYKTFDDFFELFVKAGDEYLKNLKNFLAAIDS